LKYLFVLLLAIITGRSTAQKIPSVKMDDIVKIIDSSTTPLVINFWASWCMPCIHEIPYFEKQIAQYKNKNVKLILVSLDFKEDYPEKLQAFLAKNKYTSHVLWLSETDADSFCPKIDKDWEGALPATLFVNRAKNYRRFVGVQMSEEKFKAGLEQTF
jgi:thiol-disulfide isomerase/thioredoxin